MGSHNRKLSKQPELRATGHSNQLDYSTTMFRLFIVSCLCVSSCVSRPFNGTNNSTRLWETLANFDFTDLKKYVPDNVKQIAYDLYTDIHEEVVNKTQSNVDDFSKFIENLVKEVEEIQEEEYKLFLQEEPQSREQIEKRKKEDAENKMKLRELADNIKEQMNNDEESDEPLERAIQQFITYCRSIISSQFYSFEYIWSKVRQAEGTSYKALELIARNANTLKGLVKDLFSKLSTIDISISSQRNNEVPRSNQGR